MLKRTSASAESTGLIRLAAMALGIGAFYITSRSTNIGTFASVIALGVLALVVG